MIRFNIIRDVAFPTERLTALITSECTLRVLKIYKIGSSATLPLVYATYGDSNLPTRPPKAPPSAQTAQAKQAFFSRQERGF